MPGEVQRAPALHLAAELHYVRLAHARVEQERQREPRLGCLCSNWCTSSIVQVWNTPLTAEEVGKLADNAKRTDAKWGVTKWAIIAADELTFGLTRMYMALTEDYHVTTNVFGDAIKADDWHGLGIEMEQFLRQTLD